MKKNGFIQRFVLPLILVVGIREVSRLTYNAASALSPGIFRDVVIGTAVPLTFFSLWFFTTTEGPSLSEKLTPQLEHIKRKHGLKSSDDFF
jgi:hypothetical protein